MSEVEFEFTPEQQQELREAIDKCIEAFYDVCHAMAEIVEKTIEQIKEAAIQLARFFLKLQLQEWKVPSPIADFVSKRMYWYWAVLLGFGWFQRKLLIE